MFRNYLLSALRNLQKSMFYASVNVSGLSIGVGSCLLIILYIYHEMSYDTFHTHAGHIYRVGLHGKIADREVFTTNTCPALAFTAVEEFPEVASATRIYPYQQQQVIRYGETVVSEELVYYADSTFFDVFSFTLLEGNPATALTDPNTLVIPQDIARKYFGDEPALGKTLLVGSEKIPHKVTGIMEKLPGHMHFQFHMLRSMVSLDYSRSEQWFSNSFITYLLLHEAASPAALEAKLPGLVEKYVGPEIQQALGISLEAFTAQGNRYGYFLQPLLDIHLYSHLSDELAPNSDVMYIYIFAAIGLFILLLACINFMNLTTARSASRAREVGVRKALGSLRGNLIWQFLSESVLMSLLATLIALGAALLLLPAFNHIAGREISGALFAEPWFIASLISLMLLVGFAAGSYPAFYLSSFQPVEVLKGKLKTGGSGGIRNLLVVFQFFISITLIICTLLVYKQLSYVRSKHLGFDKENIVVVDGLWQLSESQQEALKQELTGQANILAASVSNNVPPGVNNTTVFRKKGTEEDIIMATYHIDYEHLATMQIELLQGRNFSRAYPADTAAVLLNEAAVRAFGFNHPLQEEVIYFNGAGNESYRVIGVFRDFNYETLRHSIEPLALMLTTQGGHLSVRIASGNIPAALASIAEHWKQYAPDEPFRYTFLEEDYDALFRAEQRLGTVFSLFTGLAIFIACLGLLGLAAYMGERRTKEIGVRKVLGASITHVILLLSGDFARLVAFAFLLAIPVAYAVMHWWLQGFAFRTAIGAEVFLLAGVSASCIACFTVAWQSLKAASANPVDVLRSE